MTIVPTKLSGCFIIENKIFGDDRGYFFESFNQQTFEKLTGITQPFVQDNQSFSEYGVLRGLHFQQGEFAQAKLVRVLQGTVVDVAIDLRPESPTFGEHVSVELSGDNKRQFYVPRGFGHGFAVTSPTASFFYKCDNFYNKASEGGIYFADPHLNINWGIPTEKAILSEKDKYLPSLLESKIR